jgi:D-alanyl-D-alanine carboxypeptidase
MPRASARLGWRVWASVAVLAVATGCSPSHNSSDERPLPSVSTSTTPAPAASPSAGCRVCPAVAAPTGSPAAAGPLFSGRLLVYATHGFSVKEITALTKRVAGPVTTVYSAEEMVASGLAGFPDIAVDTLIADPASYALAADVPGLAGPMSTGVVLAAAEAKLRKVSIGGRIPLVGGRSVTVTAIVDAHQIGGHEMATSPHVLPLVAGASADYLLVAGAGSVAALTSVAHATWPTRTIRVKAHTANGYMSGADTVLTQLQAKLDFGEFASRPAGTGSFVPQSSWIHQHLSAKRVVQLGDVTCNRAIMPSLIAAMQEVTARGLGSTIDTADFQYEGGCWNPRVARVIAGGTLSSHSWGMAIDINVAANPLGSPPHQDPRLVSIMAAHGFAWGGRFLRPDGAHFEWVGSIPH